MIDEHANALADEATKLRARIEALETALQDIVALCEHTKPEGKNKYDRATSSLLLTIAKIARAALDKDTGQ